MWQTEMSHSWQVAGAASLVATRAEWAHILKLRHKKRASRANSQQGTACLPGDAPCRSQQSFGHILAK